MSAPNVCPACGTTNDPANVFCVNCGRQLASAGAPPAAYAPAAPPPYPVYGPGGAYVPPYAPAPPPRTASVSNILGGLFDVWSKNFLNFFAVFFVLALLTGFIGALLSLAILGTFGIGDVFLPGSPPPSVTASDLPRSLLFALLSIVASAVVSSVVVGAMTEFTVRRNRGESITIERAFRRGLDRFLDILGANLLLTLLAFGLVFLPLLLMLPLANSIATGDVATALAAFCALFFLFIIGAGVLIFVAVATVLYAPVIMMENAGAVDGLKRSWHMTKRHRWSLLGALIVAGILVVIITVAIVLPVAFALPATFSFASVVTIVAIALANGLVGAWFVILASVAYDLIKNLPASPFGAPPYYSGPTLGPPLGVGQRPPTPPAAPPPTGP